MNESGTSQKRSVNSMKQCNSCKLGYEGHGGRRCSLDGWNTEHKEKCNAKEEIEKIEHKIRLIKEARGLT